MENSFYFSSLGSIYVCYIQLNRKEFCVCCFLLYENKNYTFSLADSSDLCVVYHLKITCKLRQRKVIQDWVPQAVRQNNTVHCIKKAFGSLTLGCSTRPILPHGIIWTDSFINQESCCVSNLLVKTNIFSCSSRDFAPCRQFCFYLLFLQ